ncbi:hypothetical protein GCM10027521_31290 [Amycolatopsis cihanbeyliensis]
MVTLARRPRSSRQYTAQTRSGRTFGQRRHRGHMFYLPLWDPAPQTWAGTRGRVTGRNRPDLR